MPSWRAICEIEKMPRTMVRFAGGASGRAGGSRSKSHDQRVLAARAAQRLQHVADARALDVGERHDLAPAPPAS